MSKYPLGEEKRSHGLNKAGICYFAEASPPEGNNTGNIGNIGNIGNTSVIIMRKILYGYKGGLYFRKVCITEV